METLLPAPWTLGAYTVCLVALLGAVYYAPWRVLQGEILHVFAGACVALMVMWSLRAGISPGLGYHYLGATVLVLMFGWSLAIVAVAVVATTVSLAGTGDPGALGLILLAEGVLPVTVAYLVYRLVDARLPHHLFVYIFVSAFLGAGLAMAASGFARAGLLTAGGVYSMEHVAYEYLPFLPLMAFPEAWLSGMIMMSLVGLRPQWVLTFDDRRYLHGK